MYLPCVFGCCESTLTRATVLRSSPGLTGNPATRGLLGHLCQAQRAMTHCHGQGIASDDGLHFQTEGTHLLIE